jgi:hypothetical protein
VTGHSVTVGGGTETRSSSSRVTQPPPPPGVPRGPNCNPHTLSLSRHRACSSLSLARDLFSSIHLGRTSPRAPSHSPSVPPSSSSMPVALPYTIGVLALQGAFVEHINLINKLRIPRDQLEQGGGGRREIVCIAVRTKEDLEGCGELHSHPLGWVACLPSVRGGDVPQSTVADTAYIIAKWER